MRHILLRNNINCGNNSNCLAINNDASGSIFPFMWRKKRQNSFFNDTEYDNDCDEYDKTVPINVPKNFKN